MALWTQGDLDRAISAMWERRGQEERQRYEPAIKQMLAAAQRAANGEAEPVEEPSEAMGVCGEQLSPEEEPSEAMGVGGEQLPTEAQASPMGVDGGQLAAEVDGEQLAADVGGEQLAADVDGG